MIQAESLRIPKPFHIPFRIPFRISKPIHIRHLRIGLKLFVWSVRGAITYVGIALALIWAMTLTGWDPVDWVGSVMPGYVYDCFDSQHDDLTSLACNIYFESRGEPITNQLLTGKVVLNRTRDKRFPNTIHAVVWQYRQFSWTLLDGLRVFDREAWMQSLALAKLLVDESQGRIRIGLGGKTYENILWYHDTSVHPWWARVSPAEVRGNFVIYDHLTAKKTKGGRNPTHG